MDLDLESELIGESYLSGDITARYAGVSTLLGNTEVEFTLKVDPGYPAPVRYLPSSRIVSIGKMVLDQVDLFLGDGKTRAQGVLIADLQLKVFAGETQVDWALISGVGIPDVRVTSGRIYWTEFTTGFYSVRFFPNRVGSWRVLLTYPAQDQAISLTYDVVQQLNAPMGSGIRTSFIKR